MCPIPWSGPCRRAQAADPGGGRPRPGRSLRAAVTSSGGRGGSRLRRGRGPAGRAGRRVLLVLPAAVVLGKAVHRVSLSGGQEAFFEGHAHAFRVLGGVPRKKIRYDNLKSAVAQVIGFSRSRVENDRWTAFRSHYDLDAFYCQPGLAGAHEKGGVEGQIGWFRRNHLVPVPEVASVDELNVMIDAWDAADEARRIGGRARTVGEFFAIEQPLLKPLPVEPFETGRWFTPWV